jgi:hypothetical protein
MQRRFFLSGLLAASVVSAAACADQTPTLVDETFPPGSVPVTREVILPASEFFRFLGSFDGYGGVAGAPFVVVANDFQGLDARALVHFPGFPRTVAYQRDGTEQRDSLFTYVGGRLVMRVDTAASTAGDLTLRVWTAAQQWHAPTATWEVAVDTGGVRTPWTQPGGALGDLLAEGTFTVGPAAADSLVMLLSPEAVERLADTTSRGVIITVGESNRRLEIADLIVRAQVSPENARPDTIITVTVPSGGFRTTIYTPEQPGAPPGVIAIGGVRRARTLIELDPRQMVPGCPAGITCPAVPLADVRINQVALLLDPLPVPNGFGPLGPTPVSLRLVQEPELGRFAPLGQSLLDQSLSFSVRDTLVALPLTALAATLIQNDTLPTTFALVSESPLTTSAPSFGVGFFGGEPRLRIIYTLPSRRQLP